MALTNGVYSLCAFDNYTMLADNSNASKSANNPQILVSYNGSYSQKFKISTAESSKTNEKKITNQDSGQSWYINKTQTLANQSIVQFPDSSGASADERSWEMLEDGRSVTINGNSYNTYNINCGADTSYSIDYTDAIKASTNPLKLKASDSTSTKQSFVPMKTTYYNPSLIAPNISISGEKNNIVDCERDVITNAQLRLSNGNKYQVRVKKSYLLHDSSTWEEDPLYYSPTDLTTDYGWGDAWNYNASSNSTLPIESANSSPTGRLPYDCVKYEIEARQYTGNSSSPWSGVSNWKTYTTRQRVNPVIDGARIGGAGLVIDMSTDAFRTIETGVATIDVFYNGKSIIEKTMTLQLNIANPTFTIPYDSLTRMPAVGDEITINVVLKTNSQYVSGFTISSGAIVDEEGGDLEPVIAFTNATEYDVKCEISEKNNKPFNYVELSLIYNHDGRVIIEKLVDGKNIKETYFACPLNKEFKLFCLIEKKTGSTVVNWGTKGISHTHNSLGALVINSISHEISFLTYNEKPGDSFKKGKKPGTDTVGLKGKRYSDVYTDGILDTTYTFSNLFMETEYEDIMDSVLNDFYCLIRTYNGEYIHAAITDVSYDKWIEGGVVISINVSETTHHEDIALPE